MKARNVSFWTALVTVAFGGVAHAVGVTRVTAPGTDLAEAFDPAWGSDSQHLLVTRVQDLGGLDFVEHIDMVDFAGVRATWPKMLQGVVCRNPSLSPDGSKLAFVYDADGQMGPHLFLLANGSMTPTQLGTLSDDQMQPVWSPDGTRIAVTVQSALWIVNAASGMAEQITEATGGAIVPTWSPDGTQLAFCSGRSGSSIEVWKVAVGSHALRQLTDNPSTDCEPSWSPDGLWIAFCTNRAGNFDIWVESARGGGVAVQVTSGGGDDVQPSWSPDATRISFTSTRDGMRQVYVTDPLPDLTLPVAPVSWTRVKTQYR